MNGSILDFLKNISLSNIISNTNKTLSIIKKTIPVYKQVRPYVTREKSIFKPKKIIDIKDEIKESKPLKEERTSSYNDTLTFFQ